MAGARCRREAGAGAGAGAGAEACGACGALREGSLPRRPSSALCVHTYLREASAHTHYTHTTHEHTYCLLYVSLTFTVIL